MEIVKSSENLKPRCSNRNAEELSMAEILLLASKKILYTTVI
jgi:hypothetical protein